MNNDVPQTPFIGDALISSLVRFRDPVAFVYTVLDYLVVATGVEAGMTVDVDDWVLSTSPEPMPKGIELVDTKIGSLQIRWPLCPMAEPTLKFFSSLSHWLDSSSGSFLSDMSTQFARARPHWSERKVSFGRIKNAGSEAPAPLYAFYDSLSPSLAEYLSDTSALSPNLNIAFAYGSDTGDIHLWCGSHRKRALKGITDVEEEDLPRAVYRAAATGFAQWSSTGDGYNILAVPCVVGGFPWAIIYTKCKRPYWLEGYRLYRDVLPRLLQDIRIQARSSYLVELLFMTDIELGRDIPTIQHINEQWTTLSKCFPFSVPRLDPRSGIATDLSKLHEEAALSFEPERNQYFPLTIGDKNRGKTQTWGDIVDLVPVIESGIRSRLKIAGLAKANLAQAIAHEFKNLTSELAVISQDLQHKARMASSSSSDSKLRDLSSIVGIHGLQLNGISLALFELATPGSENRFVASDDAVELVRAALRINLELRALTQSEFSVHDELSFEQAVGLMNRTYGRIVRQRRYKPTDPLQLLVKLVNDSRVAFLLFATAEPVRNIRIFEQLPQQEEPPAIRAWTDYDHEHGELVLVQETTEAPHAPRNSVVSRGSARVNRLLPSSFCYINPEVRTTLWMPNLALSGDDEGVTIRRETRIKVLGRPATTTRVINVRAGEIA